MCQDTWEIVQGMELENVDLQLALQCAPLITGLKISNLLNIHRRGFQKVREIVKNSDISCYPLLVTEHKVTVLLYCREGLEKYFSRKEVTDILHREGYQSLFLPDILYTFRRRYQSYMRDRERFPHEMGLLLGYPAEDVEGFIRHNGKNSLYIGYWKVYEKPVEKKKLFQKYEYAKESLIQLLSYGVSMTDIIDICCGTKTKNQDILYEECAG